MERKSRFSSAISGSAPAPFSIRENLANVSTNQGLPKRDPHRHRRPRPQESCGFPVAPMRQTACVSRRLQETCDFSKTLEALRIPALDPDPGAGSATTATSAPASTGAPRPASQPPAATAGIRPPAVAISISWRETIMTVSAGRACSSRRPSPENAPLGRSSGRPPREQRPMACPRRILCRFQRGSDVLRRVFFSLGATPKARHPSTSNTETSGTPDMR